MIERRVRPLPVQVLRPLFAVLAFLDPPDAGGPDVDAVERRGGVESRAEEGGDGDAKAGVVDERYLDRRVAHWREGGGRTTTAEGEE